MKIITRSLSLVALLGIASVANAQNLVTNPSFETGDFTGYSVSANATFVASSGFDGITAQDGNFFAAFGFNLFEFFLEFLSLIF